MKKGLLPQDDLERSPVVANSLMNRERSCFGGNSYQKELFFDIIEFLKERLQTQKQTSWLDLCCGSGKALIEAANFLAGEKFNSELKIIGADLVSMFDFYPAKLDFLHLVESSAETITFGGDFDLITCVHGLHYIGDKLAVIRKAAAHLKTNGIFLANLDPANFRYADGTPASKTIISGLRKSGIEYKSRRRLIVCQGKKEINFPFEYLGADDKAGANYTKQPVIDSYYKRM
jgi:SAM-dependent methyltransferase